VPPAKITPDVESSPHFPNPVRLPAANDTAPGDWQGAFSSLAYVPVVFSRLTPVGALTSDPDRNARW
jgi:hypothetical protein